MCSAMHPEVSCAQPYFTNPIFPKSPTLGQTSQLSPSFAGRAAESPETSALKCEVRNEVRLCSPRWLGSFQPLKDGNSTRFRSLHFPHRLSQSRQWAAREDLPECKRTVWNLVPSVVQLGVVATQPHCHAMGTVLLLCRPKQQCTRPKWGLDKAGW